MLSDKEIAKIQRKVSRKLYGKKSEIEHVPKKGGKYNRRKKHKGKDYEEEI